MILRSAPASPFVRKVRIVAALAGLADRITLEPADTLAPADTIRDQNPLGKIPALLLEDGQVLYDSRVIVLYLDSLTSAGLVPSGPERFPALIQEVLADGLSDAALLQRYETTFRAPELRVAAWTELQEGKVMRALAAMERDHSAPASAIHVGHVAQACALGYLDLRFAGTWRPSHPALVAWLGDFAARVPAFDETAFRG